MSSANNAHSDVAEMRAFLALFRAETASISPPKLKRLCHETAYLMKVAIDLRERSDATDARLTRVKEIVRACYGETRAPTEAEFSEAIMAPAVTHV